jgi:hypothetical protein
VNNFPNRGPSITTSLTVRKQCGAS